jgi:glycosyltransferase involved in cell wall biosynthesis
MNVLLIHQAFVSGDEAGGTRHFELGQRLSARGDHMTVVSSQVSYLTGRPVDARRFGWRRGLFYREQVNGLTVMRAYSPAVLHKGFAWRLAAFVVFALNSVFAGLRAGPVDVVMGTTPPIFQAVSAWLVSRLRRKPFLLEIRDLWPEFAIEMGVLTNPILKRLSRWLERFLYRHADHLLVNSPAYRDYLKRKGVPETKISFVPNGVDVTMFDPSARGEAIRRRFDLDGTLVAVYAGAHGPANDLDTILDAADLVRDQDQIRFLLVGDGKERGRLQAETARRGLTNVIFTGALPKSQMPDVLAAADVCLATLKNIPMFTTTYPNKVFDYMAAGRPTVLAIGGVIRAVVEEAEGGCFVPPGDARAMADAIRHLADHPQERRSMGASARRFVEERFDRDDQAEEFRTILRRIAGCGKGTLAPISTS